MDNAFTCSFCQCRRSNTSPYLLSMDASRFNVRAEQLSSPSESLSLLMCQQQATQPLHFSFSMVKTIGFHKTAAHVPNNMPSQATFSLLAMLFPFTDPRMFYTEGVSNTTACSSQIDRGRSGWENFNCKYSGKRKSALNWPHK